MRRAVPYTSIILALALAVAGCNDNSLQGLPSDPAVLEVDPAELDFGRWEVGTPDHSQPLTLKNLGDLPLIVENIRLDPPGGVVPYVVAVPDGALPTPAEPLVISGRSSAQIQVGFSPSERGDSLASVLIHSNDLEFPVKDVPLFGHGYTFEEETTVQDEYQAFADILFVVDSSGSMGGEQAKLALSFDTFISWLTAEDVDYHIGITTTDMTSNGEQGAFVGGTTVLDNTTPDVINTFKQNVAVGTTGAGIEEGMAAALSAVTTQVSSGVNNGFLRAEAGLFIVFVSDEDDQSPLPVAQYVADIAAVKGGDTSKVFYTAIAGDPPTGGCSGAYSADRYFDLTAQTVGLFGSICDADFGLTLQQLAFIVTAPTDRFFLSQVPDPQSIQVFVDGVEVGPEAWFYDSQANAVVFFEAFIPLAGALVEITYETA